MVVLNPSFFKHINTWSFTVASQRAVPGCAGSIWIPWSGRTCFRWWVTKSGALLLEIHTVWCNDRWWDLLRPFYGSVFIGKAWCFFLNLRQKNLIDTSEHILSGMSCFIRRRSLWKARLRVGDRVTFIGVWPTTYLGDQQSTYGKPVVRVGHETILNCHWGSMRTNQGKTITPNIAVYLRSEIGYGKVSNQVGELGRSFRMSDASFWVSRSYKLRRQQG